jgi:hypothetical protein
MRRALAALAAVVVLAGCSSVSRPEARPEPPPSSTPSGQGIDRTVTESAPADWRTEVWRDVQIEVPADWALGYAPMPQGDGALLCGVGPLEGGGGSSRPYVGRPGYGSDMCLRVGIEDLALAHAGVWFGSPLPVGEVLAKTGLHQVTVGAGDSRVTVASKDEQLLRRVLASVELVDEHGNGCPLEPHVEGRYPDEGYGEIASFSVCVYERRHPAGAWERLWTGSLPVKNAERLVEAVDTAEPGRPCPPEEGGQLVLLRITADDPMGDRPLDRDLVVRPGGCRALQHWGAADEHWARLSAELVRPWAVPGVATYVHSSGQARPVTRLFRSLWG